MNLDIVIKNAKELVDITDVNNYNNHIDILHDLIMNYADNQGDRRNIEIALMEVYKVNKDEYKQEFIGEIISRISDYCIPHYRYNWLE